MSSTTVEDYSSIIWTSALVLAGLAMSRVQPGFMRGKTIPCLYLTSITCTTTYLFLASIGPQVAPGGSASVAFSTVQAIADATTGVCLETCYILRLTACLRLYKRRNIVYLLFLFPLSYIFTDILAIAELYTTKLVVSQVSFAMFNLTLMVGGIISHVATIVILLKNAGNLKDDQERKGLKRVAVLAITNQIFFLSFCLLSFVEVTYSVALIYLSWTMDHIVFSLVNEHIRSFLLSSNRETSDSGGNSSKQEVSVHKAETANRVSFAHEPSSSITHDTETV